MQELSLNILDVAQNSVRAGATLTEITVDEQPADDRLTISIRDNGCGMAPEQVRQVTDPFFTTRNTRRVGLGVPLLKMAAELTGGSLEITSEPGRGTSLRAVFGLNHIDRMPLGDIAATICSLVQCNPDIDFLYTFRHGDASFCADTREFRAVLEGIPLSTPEVVAYIGGYIRENTAEIQNQSSSDGGIEP